MDFGVNLKKGEVKDHEITLKKDDKEFIAIIRMFISANNKLSMLESIKYFISLIDIDILVDKINIKEIL